MEYELIHRTEYRYTEPVTVSQHAARLEPAMEGRQQVSDFSLSIQPKPAALSSRLDYFGNKVAVFGIRELHRSLVVEARSRVVVQPLTPPVPSLSPLWTQMSARLRDPVLPQDAGVYEFCMDSPMVPVAPEFAQWARHCFGVSTPLLSGVALLMERLHSEFEFDPVATEVATPLKEVWRTRRGVCQDFAHVAIACLRSLGLPSRYVSGYLRTIPPKGQPRMQGADASHAWFSAYCPVNGWVDFDPTNNLMPSDGHIVVAVGRDYSDVSPLCGILTGGGEHSLSVAVDVVPIEGS